jgi:hypothetical protein
MEVVKIRLQAQQHSLADPMDTPRYRNAGHAVYTIVREEGVATLYRGVTLTALRQATNQGISGNWVTDSNFEHVNFDKVPISRRIRNSRNYYTSGSPRHLNCLPTNS